MRNFMALDEFVKSMCSQEAVNVMVFKHEKDYMDSEELIHLSFWDTDDCAGRYNRKWWSRIKDIWSIIRTGYPLFHKEYCMLGIDETKELIEVLNRAIEAAKPKYEFQTGGVFTSGVLAEDLGGCCGGSGYVIPHTSYPTHTSGVNAKLSFQQVKEIFGFSDETINKIMGNSGIIEPKNEGPFTAGVE